MSKRFFAYLLAGIMILGVFAGCAAAGTEVSESTETTASTTAPDTEATKPKPTEPKPTECSHNWVYDFTPEEGHYEYGVSCACGVIFSNDDEWWAHVKSYDTLEAFTNHGSYGSYSEWIVEVPFAEWWYCTKCGITSSTNPNP